MKIYPILILLTFTFLGHHSWSQTQEAQIEEIITDYLQPNSPGLAILATQGEKVLYKKAFGLHDIEQAKALKTDHLFRIGSITKQFTATAILKLASEKRLSLDDSIEKYLPVIGEKKTIKIKHLLHHTSGLGSQADVPGFETAALEGDYPKSMLPTILKVPLKFEPGTKYAYSNFGYIVLAYLVEQVSGMTYEDYLHRHFFDPLKMDHTGFEYLNDFTASMSKGYTFNGTQFTEPAPINMEIPYGAGGLVSTVEDLDIWNRAVMKGKLLPMSEVKKLGRVNVLPDGQATEYSTGWRVGLIQGTKSIKHDGIINGYTSSAVYLPEHDLYVVVLSNCDAYRDIELPTTQIAAVLIDRAFATQAISVSTEELATYQGKYQNGDEEMKMVLHNDQLMYYKQGNNKTKMIPTGKNQFLLEGSLDQIRFYTEKMPENYTLSTLRSSEKWTKVAPMKAFTSLKISTDALDEFVGKYNIQDQMIFEVIRIEDKVYGQMGNDRKEIFCYDKDTFCALDMDATIRFLRDKDGKVTQVNVKQIGEFSGERMEE